MRSRFAQLAAILAFALAALSLPAQQPTLQPAAKPTPAAPVFNADISAERIPNLDALKAQLKQYHDCTCTCGCYGKDLDRQADHAIALLRQRVAHSHPGQKLALVLDIDETTLSNYQQMIKADFAYDNKAFNAWIASAQAPAIPGTLRLFKEAQRLGVDVFFITGRPEAQSAATERNLSAQGFQSWKKLIFRTPEQVGQTALVYKSAARAQIVAMGYTVVLNVGDQWSDLKGSPAAQFSVKYPNPYYFIP